MALSSHVEPWMILAVAALAAVLVGVAGIRIQRDEASTQAWTRFINVSAPVFVSVIAAGTWLRYDFSAYEHALERSELEEGVQLSGSAYLNVFELECDGRGERVFEFDATVEVTNEGLRTVTLPRIGYELWLGRIPFSSGEWSSPIALPGDRELLPRTGLGSWPPASPPADLPLPACTGSLCGPARHYATDTSEGHYRHAETFRTGHSWRVRVPRADDWYAEIFVRLEWDDPARSDEPPWNFRSLRRLFPVRGENEMYCPEASPPTACNVGVDAGR